MSKGTDDAARAVRNVVQRALGQAIRMGEYGIVRQTGPVTVELGHSHELIDSDELVVTAAVRQYDRDVGLEIGDVLALMPTESDEMVAVGVITDKALAAAQAPASQEDVANAVGGAIPPGSIIMTARAAAPDGWLLCNGQAVSRSTYARLFAAIGTVFGVGDGSTTFNVPDFRGRSPVGVGTGDAADATAHTLGQKAGTETHTMTVAQMATHDHGGATSSTTPGATGGPSTNTSDASSIASTGAGTSHAHGVTDPTHSHDPIGSVTYHLGTGGITNRISASLTGGGGVTTISSPAILTNNATGISIQGEAAHTHPMSHTHTMGNHTHTSAAHTHPIPAQGGGLAHPNMQPYLGVNFLIRV